MTEAQLTQKFLRRVRDRYPMAVVFKHNDHMTSGVPDASISLNGCTLWLEFKRHKTPITPLQRETMKKLAKATTGRSYFAVFQPGGGVLLHSPTSSFEHHCATQDAAIDWLFVETVAE